MSSSRIIGTDSIESAVAILVFVGVCYTAARWFVTGGGGLNSEWSD
ncbi:MULTISPECIES: hypothetical protein [Haloarcula]|nr:hypothetical protein [Halomicroarcula sp. SHR3]